MINDWFRLNLEVAMTPNKFSGMELAVSYEELTRHAAQDNTSPVYSDEATGNRKFWKRILKSKT